MGVTSGLEFSVSVSNPQPAGLYFIVRRNSDGYVYNREGVNGIYAADLAAKFEEYTEDVDKWQLFAWHFDDMGGGLWRREVYFNELPIGEAYTFQFFNQGDEYARPTDNPSGAKVEGNWGVIVPNTPLGDTPTDHNTGGTDAMRVTSDGNGVDGAIIRAYLKDEYDSNAGGALCRGLSITLADGRWAEPIYRDATLDYTFTAQALGYEIQVMQVAGEDA